MQVTAVEYEYRPLPFEATTEKQESYKAWELPKQAAPIAAPMRLTLPFEGAAPRCTLGLDLGRSLPWRTSSAAAPNWQLPCHAMPCRI
jgi:hypothetical protein